MSDITDFYINGEQNSNNVALEEILAMDDYELEKSHHIIQWIFPLHETSKHSNDAPVLTQEDIDALNDSILAKKNMEKVLQRFVEFFGIMPKDTQKISKWCNNYNHNLLRVTRIIRSLRLFDMNKLAKWFYDEVVEIAQDRRISPVTLEYWRRSLEEPVTDTLQ